MIEWPADEHLNEAGEEAISKLKASGAANELEDSAEAWRVVSWSWVQGPPWRVSFRNEAHEELQWTMEASGQWRLAPRVQAPRIRQAADLAASLRDGS